MNTDSLFLCLNAEAGKIPAKLNLLPAGGFVAGRDGRRWTKRNAEVIAQKSNEYLPQHPIDENHSTDLKASKGEAAPAMGWFTNIEAKEDGSIWADVSWTAKGKAALESQEYRYISPVFEVDTSGEIIKILRAGLTNTPNIDLPALNSTQTVQAENPAKETRMNKELCAALGLAESATENDAIAAVNALKTQLNSAKTVDLTAYAPRADLTQMEALGGRECNLTDRVNCPPTRVLPKQNSMQMNFKLSAPQQVWRCQTWADCKTVYGFKHHLCSPHRTQRRSTQRQGGCRR